MAFIEHIIIRAMALITATCFWLACEGQRFTLSADNEPLEKIFQRIEQQSSYRFVYTREAIGQARRVSLLLREASLTKVLEECFSDQPLTYLVEDRQIIVSLRNRDSSVMERHSILKGRITDEEGRPIVGATVTALESDVGTASDPEGYFILNEVRLPTVLRVSGAEIISIDTLIKRSGFYQVMVKARIDLLDETIVIAYGQTTKRYSTMSVEKLANERIERQPVSNPLSALAGHISGLQVMQGSGLPGSYLQLRIRGQNSLFNGNDPLILLDGIPFPSVSLNGKFGGPGEIASSSFDNISPNDIESIEVLKDGAATAIYGSRGANGVILLTTKRGRPGPIRVCSRLYLGGGAMNRRIRLMNTTQYLEMRKEAFVNDGIQATIANAVDLLQWDSTRYTDWQRLLMGEATQISDINTSISGGSQLTQFLMSGSLHSESAAYRGDFGLSRYSLAMNLTHRSANNRFHFSWWASGLAINNSAPREDLTRQITLPPNAPPPLLADGTLNWEHSTWTNPLSKLLQVFTNRSTNIQAGLSVDYRIAGQLTLKLTAGLASLLMRELSVLPSNSFDPAWYMEAQATYGRKRWRTLLAEPQLTYYKNISNARFDALLGMSLQQSDQHSIYQLGMGYPNDKSLSNIQLARLVSLKDQRSIRYRYAGLFARLTARVHDRYLTSVTIRRDGSSRYAPSRRFSNFGAMGLGWIASGEKFLRTSRLLSFAKLGISLGKSGNDQIEDYRYLDLYEPYDFNYLGEPTYRPVQLYNPGYGWEKVMKSEYAIDLGFRKNRYLLSIHYYRHQTQDVLVNYGLPFITGFGGIIKNVPAKIMNTGWEFQANLEILNGGKIKWSATLNVTLPRNRLVKFPDLGYSNLSKDFVVGESLNIARTFRLEGLDPETGLYRFRDFDGDGRITSQGDQQFVVDMSQRSFGGVEQEFKMGSFTATLLIQFVVQPNAPGYAAMFARPGNRSNQPEWLERRWRQEGDDGPFQRASSVDLRAAIGYTNFQRSDAMFQDASFLRLRNLYFDYRLADKHGQRWGFRELSLFIQGQNLITLTRYRGLDPETKNYLPPTWMLTFGMKMQL